MLDLSGRRKLPTVLLIDDDIVSREVTATVLTMTGYTVHTVASGAAALKMLGAPGFNPDGILMDVEMPGLGGTELIAKMRGRGKAKIVVISGSKPPDEIAAAADGFLLKPFAADALTNLLRGQAAPAREPAPGPPAGEMPVIGSEALANLRALMPEPAVREIYQALVSDLDSRMRALEAAIALGDAAEVRRIGHAIKGGCGMAGALQASRVGALLETFTLDPSRRPEGNQSDYAASLLRELRAAALKLQRMLEGELPA